MSMEDILSDTKPEPVASVEAPEQAVEAVSAAPEPTPAPEPVATPEPTPVEPIDETTGMTPKEKAFYMKSKDEVQKRQQLEKEYAILKAQIEQVTKNQQPTQTEPPKEFWEDPEGALNAHQERVRKEIEEARRLSTNTRLDVSEMIVKREHPDYPEKLAVFHQLAQQNPQVVQDMLKSENPAEFVYNLGKSHLELKQAGDLPTLRAQIEKETRLKLEAEFKAREEAKAAELANIPSSLTGVRSTSVNKPVWSGPPPLDDILH